MDDNLLDEEDDQTLAAIDQAVKSADEGRLVTAEEARQRLQQWSIKSSTPKTR
jgi:predicted transcriptional regulator